MRRLQVYHAVADRVRTGGAGAGRARPDRDWTFHHDRATGAADLCAAGDPGAGLYLDAGLLGVWDDGYYWVPGTWVQPPAVGLLWTPGYWGWNNGVYAWNGGYWGPHVGFYGGVNYGFGYTGDGYYGGRWDHGAFAYNRSVNNFGNVHVTNVYNSTVINNNNRVAFNGGNGGIAARPTQQQEAFAHEQHVGATSLQTAHEHTAASNPQLRYTANHGQPPIAATAARASSPAVAWSPPGQP